MKTIAVILSLSAIILPVAAFGVSYHPALYHLSDRHDIFSKGEVAYLFHSGTAEVRETIHQMDILKVYRTGQSCEVSEVGRVRILSSVGENYLKCEVAEGQIRPDDIAKKGNVSCLVISAGICNHSQ